MKQKSLILARYTVPFRTPFQYATGTIEAREGFILGNGSNIWSEIAPLPGFSEESIEDAGSFLKSNWSAILQHFQKSTLGKFLDDDTQNAGLESLPSVRFGLSMLDEQQKAIAAGLPLYSFWRNLWFSNPTITKNYVYCNALVHDETLDELLQSIHLLKETGFRTVKIKLPGDAGRAYEIITETCARFPDIIFRYDANRSFSLPVTRELFKKLRSGFDSNQTGTNIQYIEEPLSAPDDPSFSELRNFGISVAADESARTSAEVHSLTQSESVDFLVIKPMLFGSFREMEALIQSNISVTVSSVFETAVGRTLLAHIAALFNSNRETDHGLATGPFLVNDVTPSMPGPHIKFNSNPGIGISPNIDQPWISPEPESRTTK